MIVEEIEVGKIIPAEYNPRKISDEQFEELKNSLLEVGFVIPVIVNKENNTIIAGHQRTRAAKAIGMSFVPCIRVANISNADEIKFNQLHNGCDINGKNKQMLKQEPRFHGFGEIETDGFVIDVKNRAYIIKVFCNLLNKYGNCFCAVTCGKEVIIHEEYIHACNIMGMKAIIYNIEPEKREKAIKYFSESCGVYSYDNLKRHTYVQGLAQLARLSDYSDVKYHSSLYENFVIPYIKNNKVQSVLDFGCGRGGYIKKIQADVRNAVGVEFYNNNLTEINVGLGNRQIDRLIDHIKKNGLFDVVVCDSVLNSVDCMKAEKSVLRCLNTFVKPDGVVFVSGRSVSALRAATASKDTGDCFHDYFVDENMFTAKYRMGKWFFQHFHSKDRLEPMLKENYLIPRKITYNKYSQTWQAVCTKDKLPENDAVEALEFEFDLPLPSGGTYGRQNDVINALRIAKLL